MESKKGFTLIEVLVVVLILAILASLVVPRIAQSTGDAKDATDAANRAMLIRALELYATNNDGSYPADQAAFNSAILNSTTYFPHGVPTCPYSNSYVYVDTLGQETVTAHTSGN
jgi:general secretion pathway protein G